MGSVWVREFTGGLDSRRLPETSPGGTLVRLRDAHINKGGEIEQRAIFEKVHSLPTGDTKGLAATKNGLTVFGHQDTPAGIPASLTYQKLQHPSGEALRELRAAELFKGKLQTIAVFEDDSRYMFHDGSRVTDPNAPPTLADSGTPRALLTSGSKMFVASGPNLFFSAVGDSTIFDPDHATPGAGFIVMSTHAQAASELTGLGIYSDFVAVFADSVILTWYVDPDPSLSRKSQVLNNTGAIAPRSITQFGDGDIFYLDQSGVRSLRARDSSNSAATTDIGSPVDEIVVDHLIGIGSDDASKAIGLIEPRTGRFWLAVKDRIFVFSYFTGSKVSAWSEYYPGFDIDEMVVHDGKVWLRSGDDIYVYGGQEPRPKYSADVQAEVWLPFLDATEPWRSKGIEGVDAAVRGTWEFDLALDPADEDQKIHVARFDKTTFSHKSIGAMAEATHFSPRLKSLAPPDESTPAKLSSVVVHFDRDQEDDA